MSVIKSLKIKQADGTFGEPVDFGAKAENISIEGEGSFLNLQSFLRTKPVKYYGSFIDAIFEAQFLPVEEALVTDPAVEIIVTDGFYESKDGGAGIYRMIRDTVIHTDETQNEKNLYFKYDEVKKGFYFQPNNTSVTFELLRFDDKVNIKQIGATGNGNVSSVDCIKEALKSELPIYFPQGHYRIDEELKLTKNRETIEMYGDHELRSIIQIGPDDINNFLVSNINLTSMIDFNNTKNIYIHNLGFNGQNGETNDTYTIKTTNGLNLNGESSGMGSSSNYIKNKQLLENLNIKNVSYYGIRSGIRYSIYCKNLIIEDIGCRYWSIR